MIEKIEKKNDFYHLLQEIAKITVFEKNVEKNRIFDLHEHFLRRDGVSCFCLKGPDMSCFSM